MSSRPSDLLTSGEAAAICGVAVRTFSKWMDAGLVKGFRLPVTGNGKSGGDRRIFRSDLDEFIERNGLKRRASPLSILLLGPATAPLEPALAGHGWTIHYAPDVFTAGRLYAQNTPLLVLADGYLGILTIKEVQSAVRTPVILYGEDEAGRWGGRRLSPAASVDDMMAFFVREIQIAAMSLSFAG